ncbi:CrcB family protein [Rummeliibacillus sp. SL167]|uniref:fluoride efflux transporter FluC n=1 Tax=Rummeliibacillus sp. SL167 TaxID=2579792 RepID=UPI002106FFD2|nr:CrcB family protein [Rummeliibacillus sp. SL167]
MIKNVVGVVLGGILGTLMRYGVMITVPTEWMLWIVNGVGSFAMGILNGLFTRFLQQNMSWKLFLTTGMLGGFTTFSTFSASWLILMQEHVVMAVIYAIIMTTLCVALASFGYLLAVPNKKAGERL